MGWYSDADFTQKAEPIVKGSVGEREFYAKWEEIPYTITYELNAADGSGRFLQQDIRCGYLITF